MTSRRPEMIALHKIFNGSAESFDDSLVLWVHFGGIDAGGSYAQFVGPFHQARPKISQDPKGNVGDGKYGKGFGGRRGIDQRGEKTVSLLDDSFHGLDGHFPSGIGFGGIAEAEVLVMMNDNAFDGWCFHGPGKISIGGGLVVEQGIGLVFRGLLCPVALGDLADGPGQIFDCDELLVAAGIG